MNSVKATCALRGRIFPFLSTSTKLGRAADVIVLLIVWCRAAASERILSSSNRPNGPLSEAATTDTLGCTSSTPHTCIWNRFQTTRSVYTVLQGLHFLLALYSSSKSRARTRCSVPNLSFAKLAHYRPAMPYGNRKNYSRGSFQFSIVTI